MTIVGELGAMAGVEAIFEAALRAGAHPSFHPKSERLHELLLRHGSDEQLRHTSPFEQHRLAHCDVLIVLNYARNARYLGGIDPARVAMAQAARREFFTMSTKRAAAGEMRYCLVEIPGEAAAQDAGMSLADYEDFVFRAGWLHLPDPVAAWRALGEQQQRVCDYLESKKVLRFRAPASDVRGAGSSGGRAGAQEGTDLTVDVSGRKWISCAGKDNFPDGEVFSGPRDAEGVVNFMYPASYRGQQVDGVRLAFKGGRVVEASATRNEEYLIKMLDSDEGARGMGEIAIGTNYGLTGPVCNPFFDEKIGGTFHLAVGGGFLETGSTNESGLHWDMVSDLRRGGTIHADGELMQRDGRFVFPGWPGN
ncbi:MAG: aminopeptidase [Phycisphaerales bacterium]